jgi:SAM-dependent methyltransferase
MEIRQGCLFVVIFTSVIFLLISSLFRENCAARQHGDSQFRFFDESEIMNLWENIKVSDGYLEKWLDTERAVSEVNRIFKFDARGRDYPRVPILLDFNEWIIKYNLTHPARILVTDPRDPELNILKPGHITTFIFNHSSGDFDLHLLGVKKYRGEDQNFDLIVISQTFEHLYDPLLVANNLFKALRPGGYVFTSAPALNVQHLTPFHFFHYTPMGLVMLFARANFHVVELGQWGNEHYESLLLKNNDWPDVYQLRTSAKSNMIKNQRSNPDQVWVLARRPLNRGN